MLLTITTTHVPATDLGYLLHKNPARPQSFSASFGQIHVVFPEATEERCTAALILDVDPVKLVRRGRDDNRPLEQYVNDRPYVTSSFLSVALANVFRNALAGQSKERPELAATKLPLRAHLPVVPSRGGEALLRGLFEPLGYALTISNAQLDPKFPSWGQSPYFNVDLEAEIRLADLLNHLYVLIPVLDDEKHYWVGEDEMAKLLRHGDGWLDAHPERDTIIRRYLRRKHHLISDLMEQLTREETVDRDEVEVVSDEAELAAEAPVSLNTQRLNAVLEELKASGAQRVLDLGFGEGRLIRLLVKEKQFTEIVGIDVSHRQLQKANDRLERLPALQKERIKLVQGSLTYRDDRLAGYDAAAIVEVIEHLDPARLAAFSRAVFEFARPATVVLTTPNFEYNVKWATLPAETMRHKDHRFEWTRAQFQAWAEEVAAHFGYKVRFVPIGPEDETVGAPTQMGVFTRD